MKKALPVLILAAIGLLLVMTVAEMPTFGDSYAPAHRGVMDKILRDSAVDTGAINTIAAIILDYRAYDTLGEATVLFVAVLAVSAAFYGGEPHA